MEALYVRHRAAAADARVDASQVAGWAADATVRVFSTDAPLMCFPYSAEEPGHLLHACPAGTFASVVHHRSQPLFDGAWTRAYLGQLHRSVRAGGTLVVPYASERQAAAKGFVSLAALESRLGSAARVDEAASCAVFRRDGEIAPVDSVLSWYFDEGPRLALDDLLVRPALRGADPEDVRHLLGDLPLPAPWEALVFRGEGPTDTAVVARKHSYWFVALAAKAAVMRRIIADRFDAARALTYVDHGGGLGLLAAELLLDPDVPVARAVNCDLEAVNVVLSGHLHRHFRDRLSGRFFAHHGAAESFPYREPVDVISFVGSLLYVPRAAVAATLERAWEALGPGGLLVVHENIRSDRHRGGVDYEVMFERDELETLLGRFGPIDAYASTVAAPLGRDQVGDKTVFRVVAKGGRMAARRDHPGLEGS